MHIKICGLRTEDTIAAVAEAGADYVGFNFISASPRFVTDEEAPGLIAQAKSLDLTTVGLFSQIEPDEIKKRALALRLDVIQLHGNETGDQIAAVKDALGGPLVAPQIWVARGISTPDDLKRLAQVPADFFLFDAKPPKGEKAQGGHGAVFDWSVLGAYDGATPWLLAGGLSSQNVGAAVAACRALPGFAGVDVSSGVERARGEKDPALIRDFVTAARAAMGVAS